MKRKILTLLGAILGMSIGFSNVYASNINYKKYSVPKDESIKGTDITINIGTYALCTPARNYDFLDEEGLYNTVYISNDNVYWSKFDNDMNEISTVSWPLFYNVDNEQSVLAQQYRDLTYNFGNALYYDSHLYVMYSRIADSSGSAQYEDNVMAMAKYDKDGNMVNVVEYKGKDLNYSTYYDQDGTCFPFYSANCSLTINDGLISCLFGRNMYNNHQASLLMFIDPDTLEFVSNMRDENADIIKYYNVFSHNISHSLGQRIIPTSDGRFLLMEVGDASSTRGLMLTKIYDFYDEENDTTVLNKSTRRMIHFREGGTDSHGYNNTYSVLGNIIEVDDGYIYIGSSEKTLSLKYGNGINESWNLFTQKYSKDFYNEEKTDEEVQLLKTRVRSTSDEKSEYNGKGRLFLSGDEKDYGIKWLTDFNNKVAIIVRAVKMDNENIAILWEEFDIEEYYYNDEFRGYLPKDKYDRKTYCMVIDKDCNIISKAKEITDAKLSDEELYVYKDGKIYWTTSEYSKNIYLNELEIDLTEPEPVEEIQKGDVNEDGFINSTDAAIVLDFFKNGGATERDYELGDMDGDNLLNSTDASTILDIFKNKN